MVLTGVLYIAFSRMLAEQTGVSASTVRYRIRNLEETGILTGYHPEVNYEAASYQL